MNNVLPSEELMFRVDDERSQHRRSRVMLVRREACPDAWVKQIQDDDDHQTERHPGGVWGVALVPLLMTALKAPPLFVKRRTPNILIKLCHQRLQGGFIASRAGYRCA